MSDLDRIGGVNLTPPSEEDELASLTSEVEASDNRTALLVQAIREHKGIRSSQASDLDRSLYELAERVARQAGIPASTDERESRDG